MGIMVAEIFSELAKKVPPRYCVNVETNVGAVLPNRWETIYDQKTTRGFGRNKCMNAFDIWKKVLIIIATLFWKTFVMLY